jgi:hypothetical protein
MTSLPALPCLKENIVCFDGFIDKLFISKYCSTTPILFEVVFCSSFKSCPTFNIDVSSAYIIDLPFVRCGISFIYNMKNDGPRTDPWGTPYLTGRLPYKFPRFYLSDPNTDRQTKVVDFFKWRLQ